MHIPYCSKVSLFLFMVDNLMLHILSQNMLTLQVFGLCAAERKGLQVNNLNE